MMISKTLSLNFNIKFKKGADFMKVILFYLGMMAGAVLLEQMVDATNIMRVEEVIVGFIRY
jgi:hypothetical protein